VLLALTLAVAALVLVLLALAALLRVEAVRNRVRLWGKRLNAVTRRVAGTRLGSLYFQLSALEHVGRSSGRAYVTPLAAYPLGDGFVFMLTHGPKTDWWRNILASGTCTLTLKGRTYALERPEILPMSAALSAYPPIVRLFIRATGVRQCVWVHARKRLRNSASMPTPQPG
jgi:deazaflavin-dependent oxidoreductase (nitroreductase family)